MPSLSPADKARATRLRKAVATTEQALLALSTEADVVDLFETVSPTLRSDVFWALDNDWRSGGHSLLRRTRNHPEHGHALFALFK